MTMPTLTTIDGQTAYRCQCGRVTSFMTTAILCEITHELRCLPRGLVPGTASDSVLLVRPADVPRASG